MMMETLVAAQNQPSLDTIQRTVISKVVSTPISVAPVNAPQYQMHPNFPWGMPPNYTPEGQRPQVSETPVVPAVMYVPPPVIHTTPYHEESVFHATPSESMGVYDKTDDFQDQFAEMQKEIKALREKIYLGRMPIISALCQMSKYLTLKSTRVLEKKSKFQKY